jgi:hypothetical protein
MKRIEVIETKRNEFSEIKRWFQMQKDNNSCTRLDLLFKFYKWLKSEVDNEKK